MYSIYDRGTGAHRHTLLVGLRALVLVLVPRQCGGMLCSSWLRPLKEQRRLGCSISVQLISLRSNHAVPVLAGASRVAFFPSSHHVIALSSQCRQQADLALPPPLVLNSLQGSIRSWKGCLPHCCSCLAALIGFGSVVLCLDRSKSGMLGPSWGDVEMVLESGDAVMVLSSSGVLFFHGSTMWSSIVWSYAAHCRCFASSSSGGSGVHRAAFPAVILLGFVLSFLSDLTIRPVHKRLSFRSLCSICFRGFVHKYPLLLA